MLRGAPLATAAAIAALGLGAPVAATAEGTLVLFANGEDLATEGFVGAKRTRDGWELRFAHVYVTVTDVAAHQASVPYAAAAGGEIVADVTVTLPGTFTVDLVAGGDDDRVLIGEVAAPAGHYDAISWRMVPATEGPAAGYSLAFVGTAERAGERVDFVLASDETSAYRCGEFVGDERKGFVADGGSADVELTFHLDHVFGRADKAADDALNVDALGFDAFAAGGEQALVLAGLHVGHTGEGHCDVVWE